MMKKIKRTSSLSWGSSEVAGVGLHVFEASPKRTVPAPCDHHQMPTDWERWKNGWIDETENEVHHPKC
jgi:hypothetical protein